MAGEGKKTQRAKLCPTIRKPEYVTVVVAWMLLRSADPMVREKLFTSSVVVAGRFIIC